MSIASMTTLRVLKQTEGSAETADAAPTRLVYGAPPAAPVQSQPVPTGVPADVLSNLTTWIPAETVTAYVSAQALLGNLTPPAGQPLYRADFTTRWVIFGLALALTPILVALYTAIKTRAATRNFSWKKDFDWPWFDMVFASISFVLWAVALPDTPANNFEGWQAWWGGAAILFATPLITLIAAACGQTADAFHASNVST